jgi:hypothetical protein
LSDPAYHDFRELVPDFVRGTIRIHDRDAARLFSGERQKSTAHLSMKAFCLTVQSVLLSASGSPPSQAH